MVWQTEVDPCYALMAEEIDLPADGVIATRPAGLVDV